jgi:predicted peptidase
MVLYTKYLLYVPKKVPPNGLYPLLLFLHGSDQRGDDLNALKIAGLPSFLDDKSDFLLLLYPLNASKTEIGIHKIYLLSLII